MPVLTGAFRTSPSALALLGQSALGPNWVPWVPDDGLGREYVEITPYFLTPFVRLDKAI